MDFSSFDARRYPTLSVVDGYGEWARTYEDTVLDLMDLALFRRLVTPDWRAAGRIIDLACGTGRIGVWLKSQGVKRVDGIDLTPEMLEQAKTKRVYENTYCGDVAATGLDANAYGLATMSLADEHIADLGPAYKETARLLLPCGEFVLVGYHSHFLMATGMPTHYDNAAGEPVAVESHVHLMSDHVAAAHAAGFQLAEMVEGLIDDAWIASKPKWGKLRNHPVSFAFVWKKK